MFCRKCTRIPNMDLDLHGAADSPVNSSYSRSAVSSAAHAGISGCRQDAAQSDGMARRLGAYGGAGSEAFNAYDIVRGRKATLMVVIDEGKREKSDERISVARTNCCGDSL